MSRAVTTKVFTIDELSPEAQERAIDRWISADDLPFLGEAMQEKLVELLDTHKIGFENEAVYYSLSYCQGDGAMFTGDFVWGAWSLEVRHSGMYYHERSGQVWNAESMKTGKPMTDKALAKWQALYIKICCELRDFGYAYIEAEHEAENVKENMRANDYEFYANGDYYYER